jgi:hypothetical protein
MVFLQQAVLVLIILKQEGGMESSHSQFGTWQTSQDSLEHKGEL